MSQKMIIDGLAANGSITAVSGSIIRIMSDSLIAFQPAIEEPSNMIPSRNASSLMVEMCWAVCCHLPRGSVNRRSTYSTEFSFIISNTFATPDFSAPAPEAFFAIVVHFPCLPPPAPLRRDGGLVDRLSRPRLAGVGRHCSLRGVLAGVAPG